VERPIGDNEFRSHWLVFPLAALKDHAPEGPPVTLQLITGEQPMLVEARAGEITVRPGKAEHPDAVITGRPSAVLGLLLKKLEFAEAKERDVEFQFQGDLELLQRVRP
jgi:hypothetical protein